MIFRVKQIDDNIFIAQVKDRWYGDWASIDNVDNFSWWSTESYSHNKTLEDALSVIERHKKYIERKKEYPKYYKV